MAIDIEQIQQIRSQTLEALRALEGSVWKEVQGELHAPHREIPTWILLYEDSNLEEVHNPFREVVLSFMNKIDDFSFTVTYDLYLNGIVRHLDALMDNDEIVCGYSVGHLGSMPSEAELRPDSVFVSRDSTRN